MTVVKKAEIKVTAKTDQAAQEFQKLSQSQDKAAASLNKYIEAARKQNAAETSASLAKQDQITKSLSGSTLGLGSAFKGAALGIGALVAVGGAAITVIGEMANRSMELQGVFQNLPISIEMARESTRGLITDFELAKSANTLHSFGVIKTAEEFAKLSAASQALGQKLGLSASSTMESLSAALGRNSKLMLDNLGIVLSITDAEKRYAASLGKSAKDLSDVEKGEAFRAEAMKAIFAAADDVKVATDGAAASLVRFQVELQNVRDRALGGGPAAMSLADGIGKLDAQTRKHILASRSHGASLDIVQDALRRQGVAAADLGEAFQPYIDALHEVLEKEKALAKVQTPEKVAKLVEATNLLVGKGFSEARNREIQRELAYLGNNEKAQKRVNELLIEKAEITAFALDLEGKLDEAQEVRFNEEIRQLKLQSDQLNSHAKGTKQLTAEQKLFNAELLKSKQIRGMSLDSGPALVRGFDEGLQESKDGQVVKSIAEARKQQQIDAMSTELRGQQSMLEIKLQGIELERAAGVDPWSLAQQEADAKLFALDAQQRYVDSVLVGQERLIASEEITAQRRGILHEHELARIAKDQKAEAAHMARRAAQLRQSVEMAGTVVDLGNMVATATGASAEKQKIVGDILAGGQLMTIGTVEMVKAAAAFASQNYVGGAMHTAASILAFAKGGMLLAGAGGGGGGGGGGGNQGAMFGPGTPRDPGRGGGGSSPRSGEIGEGPPISRPNSPPPRGGPVRGQTINIYSTLGPDSAQIGELRKAIRRSERDDGEVN